MYLILGLHNTHLRRKRKWEEMSMPTIQRLQRDDQQIAWAYWATTCAHCRLTIAPSVYSYIMGRRGYTEF